MTKTRKMEGLKILITGGPTREYIDRIRFITNRSSGKMATEMAKECLKRKAKVTFIYGKGYISPPEKIKLINVETTKQMLSAVLSEIKLWKYDIFISVAAPCDYQPIKIFPQKVPSILKKWKIELNPLPKIVSEARRIDSEIFIVGFKAEYKISKKELLKRAYQKLKKDKLNLIVANDVGKVQRGFESDTNEVYMVNSKKEISHISLSSKRKVAKRILDVVISQFSNH